MACYCCIAAYSDDSDAFDGRFFCRAGKSSQRRSVLSCQPCAGAGEEVIDPNPDPQKHWFESVKGRWGDQKNDQFSKPADGKRDVVANGLARFEAAGGAVPSQPPWEQLAHNVICILAFNPNHFTLNGTCCYLVGTGPKRILIDSGEEDIGAKKFLDTLEQCMEATDVEGLQEILITHWHHDHYGGVPGLLARFGHEIPVAKLPNPDSFWKSIDVLMERGLTPYLEFEDGTPRYVPQAGFSRDTKVPPECMVVWPDEEAEAGKALSWDPARRTKSEVVRDYHFVKRSWKFGKWLASDCNFHPLSHGDLICTEGATLVAYHTPGHSADHCSYWLQENKSLFSGDHVLGWGTTFISDLYDYVNTLQFMRALRPEHLYPGHGPMIEDGVGFVEKYIVHRKTREDQVEDVLLQNPEPLSCATIVSIIYTNTPKHRLWMAEENVQKILLKFNRSGTAMSFLLQDNETLERYVPSTNVFSVYRLPERLVWLHRFHFRAETRGHATTAARL